MKETWKWLKEQTEGLCGDSVDIERCDFKEEYDKLYEHLVDDATDDLKYDKFTTIGDITMLVVDDFDVVYVKEYNLVIQWHNNNHHRWSPEFSVRYMEPEEVISEYTDVLQQAKEFYDNAVVDRNKTIALLR